MMTYEITSRVMIDKRTPQGREKEAEMVFSTALRNRDGYQLAVRVKVATIEYVPLVSVGATSCCTYTVWLKLPAAEPDMKPAQGMVVVV